MRLALGRLSHYQVGSCCDNAAAESLNATIKKKMVQHRVFATNAHAKTAVAEYLEVFYNRQLIHSVLNNKILAAVIAKFLTKVIPVAYARPLRCK